MAYVLQSFSSGAILTNSQLFQTEENIATHVHGLDGVAGTGVSIRREKKTQAFTIQPSDSGKLFECFDAPYAATFQPAGTLGDNFSIMLKNQSALDPVMVLAASGQTIDGRSGYLLCPRESVSFFGDSAQILTTAPNDPVVFLYSTIPTSTGEVEVSLVEYANHFRSFEAVVCGVSGSQGTVGMRFSTDSLSSYFEAGYTNTVGGVADHVYLAVLGGQLSFSIRFNQGTDVGSRIGAVFHTRMGNGALIGASEYENFAAVSGSPGVVHGILFYGLASDEYLQGLTGNSLYLRGYGRK